MAEGALGGWREGGRTGESRADRDMTTGQQCAELILSGKIRKQNLTEVRTQVGWRMWRNYLSRRLVVGVKSCLADHSWGEPGCLNHRPCHHRDVTKALLPVGAGVPAVDQIPRRDKQPGKE